MVTVVPNRMTPVPINHRLKKRPFSLYDIIRTRTVGCDGLPGSYFMLVLLLYFAYRERAMICVRSRNRENNGARGERSGKTARCNECWRTGV